MSAYTVKLSDSNLQHTLIQFQIILCFILKALYATNYILHQKERRIIKQPRSKAHKVLYSSVYEDFMKKWDNPHSLINNASSFSCMQLPFTYFCV